MPPAILASMDVVTWNSVI